MILRSESCEPQHLPAARLSLEQIEMRLHHISAFAIAQICVLAAACNKEPAPTTVTQDVPPQNKVAPLQNKAALMPTDIRPNLRKVLVPHPETLAKHVSDETRAQARAYVAAHPHLQQEIRTAMQANEIWGGMTAEEVRLVIGEPTTSEPISGKAGHHALFYRHEGWVFRFDDRGFLYEYVER